MVEITKIRAIDIHTHAEEPCGCHADDGYDELRSTMAKYFGAPWQHPPTIPETAAHFREKNVAAVIFPVDAEAQTGYRRSRTKRSRELAAENSDIMIPFAQHRSAQGKDGRARGAPAGQGVRRQGLQVPPDGAGLLPERPHGLADLRGDRRIRAAGAVPHAARPASARACAAAAACGCKYSNPMHLDDVAIDFPDMTDHHGASVLPLAGRGARGRHAQAERLDRPVGLVAEVFPADLVQYANTLLKKRMLFGPTGR